MSRGPEANFWSMLRSNLPKNTYATRIENKHGGGVPDVHLLWEGLPVWIELKVSKSNAVKVSPHQAAWHMAYHSRGGLSFFLVKALSTGALVLFEGSEGPNLLAGGLSEAHGSSFKNSAALLKALRPRIFDHYANVLGSAAPLDGPRS